MNFFKKQYERLKWWFTPADAKQKIMDEALTSLRLFPLTNDLLKLAAAEGIAISFNPALIGTGVAGQVRQEKDKGAFLEIAPSFSSGQVGAVLVHELRHVWQNKVLGIPPGTIGAGDADPELSLIFTRVKEADAYAFSSVLIKRMNAATKKMAGVVKIAQHLAAKDGAVVPTAQHFDEAAKKMNIPTQPVETGDDVKKELAAEFRDTLQKKLASYDASTLHGYQVRYTHPYFAPLAHWTRPDGTALSLRHVQGLLRDAWGKSYLGDMDDQAFKDTVLKDVDPGIRQTLSLMQAFEAAAKAQPANDNQKLLDDIDDGVRAAQKSLLKRGGIAF